MNKEQIEVLNVVQQVLRVLTVSLGAMNPAAMATAAQAMRAAAHEGLVTNEASRMLDDLALGIEKLTGPASPAGH